MSTSRTLIPFLLLALSGLSACAMSRTDPQAFQAGVAAYDAGDYGRAYDIWAPLAESGDLAAQRNVAHLKRRGMGVEQDLEAARDLYEEAAERGLVSAQVNLGFLYLEGKGTERDVRKAVRWFQRAARAGSAEAQHQLARMLEEGDGLKRDWEKAVIYYAAAAGQGHQPSRHRLARIKVIAENIQTLTPLVRPNTGESTNGAGPLYGGTRELPALTN
ncbi:MAG: tetratricopeptide repeat protein [Alphaproteobacteria bacterium]